MHRKIKIMSPRRINKLAPHIDALENVYLRSYYWLLLLTMSRRDELRTLRREHVDYERAEIFFPETKNGSSHTVPLSTAAIKILREIPKQPRNPYVFCGKRLGKPLESVDGPWQRITTAAGVDVRIIDLRRSSAASLSDLGYPAEVTREILGHPTDPTTGTPVDTALVRSAIEDYGRQVMAARTASRSARAK